MLALVLMLVAAPLEFKPVEKILVPGVWPGRIDIKCEVTNVGDKPIRAAEGVLVWTTLFKRVVTYGLYTFSKPLAPGATVVDELERPYNKFDDEDRAFEALQLKDALLYFLPISIMYQDGTEWSRPERDAYAEIDRRFKR